jgi:hypothetical protein
MPRSQYNQLRTTGVARPEDVETAESGSLYEPDGQGGWRKKAMGLPAPIQGTGIAPYPDQPDPATLRPSGQTTKTGSQTLVDPTGTHWYLDPSGYYHRVTPGEPQPMAPNPNLPPNEQSQQNVPDFAVLSGGGAPSGQREIMSPLPPGGAPYADPAMMRARVEQSMASGVPFGGGGDYAVLQQQQQPQQPQQQPTDVYQEAMQAVPWRLSESDWQRFKAAGVPDNVIAGVM